MASEIVCVTDPETGRTIVTEIPIPASEKRRLDSMMGTPQDGAQSDISPARARLAKLKAQGGPRVVPVEVQGEQWFIKRLNWPETVAYSMMLSRDEKGQLVAGVNRTRDMTIAVLSCCVVSSADDNAPPYFNREDAAAFVDEPEAALLVGELFDKATDINPDILPGKSGEAKAEASEPDFSASGGSTSTAVTANISESVSEETNSNVPDGLSDTGQAIQEPFNS